MAKELQAEVDEHLEPTCFYIFVNKTLCCRQRFLILRLAEKLKHGFFLTNHVWIEGVVELPAQLILLRGTGVSVCTYAGLLLLGIPLPLILAVLAGLLTFIPNIGPILAAVPPILLGYMQSPSAALYVFILYLAIQAVESYVITPLIPPAPA